MVELLNLEFVKYYLNQAFSNRMVLLLDFYYVVILLVLSVDLD